MVQSDFDNTDEIKENLGIPMADLALEDDDDEAAAVMEDSDLEEEEDEVSFFLNSIPYFNFQDCTTYSAFLTGRS